MCIYLKSNNLADTRDNRVENCSRKINLPKNERTGAVVGLISQSVTEYTDENQLVGKAGSPASPQTTSVPISRTFVSILDGANH